MPPVLQRTDPMGKILEPPGEHLGAHSPEPRLDSWKAIAAHLNRDVSTVRRWEKREGLPVHRHLHHKLGSVYGFPSEIDGWWRSRRGGVDPDGRGEETNRESDGHGPNARRSGRWLIGASLAVLIFCAIAALVTGTRGAPTIPDGNASIAILPFQHAA